MLRRLLATLVVVVVRWEDGQKKKKKMQNMSTSIGGKQMSVAVAAFSLSLTRDGNRSIS